MKTLIKRRVVGWSVFIIVFLLFNEYDHCERDKLIKDNIIQSTLPSSNKEFMTPKQKSNFPIEPRAKVPFQTKEPYSRTSDEIDKYLKKKLPIYKKETYWGQEWDIPDITWDEEGDEFEGDPDHGVK